VVVAIFSSQLINNREISKLEYKILENNARYVAEISERYFQAIENPDRSDVDFFKTTLLKDITKSLAKSLTHGESLYIVDTTNYKTLLSVQDNNSRVATEGNIRKIMKGRKAGNKEFLLEFEGAESTTVMAAFGEHTHWNWTIISLAEKKTIFKQTEKAMLFPLIIVAFFLSISTFLAFKLANRLSQSVRILESGAHQISTNNFSHKIEIEGDDEFSRLATDFNNMATKILQSHEQLALSIAEANRVNQELNESQKRFLLATASAGLGVWDYDVNLGKLVWDDRMFEMYGTTRVESPDNQEIWVNSLHPDDKANAIAEYQAGLRGNKDFSTAFRIINPNGRLKYIKASAVILRNASGKIVRILGINADVTARELSDKRALEMLAEVQQANAELSFKQHALDEHAIVSIANARGDITYVNNSFCEISGYSREELMGLNHRLLRNDGHSQEFITNIEQTIARGKTWRGEMKDQRKNGGYYWVAATIVPSLNQAGELVSWIAIRTDITKIKSTEEQLRRSQKMESIGALAGGIAHDFNNLLGIIIGYLDLIGHQLENGSKLQKQLDKAQNAAFRGSSLTGRLLNFSRQSATDQSLVNVGKVIYDFKDLIRKSLTASIAIEIHRPNNLWMVELNPDDLEDALINLAINARDAMPNGGSLVINVKNTRVDESFTSSNNGLEPGEYVELSVSDTGIGMDSATTGQIFDPFFTTKKKGDGTGLGLTMVYGFVQRNHGYLGVSSEVGMGTTFSMHLPRAKNMPKQSPNANKVDTLLPTGNETILIVDDEVELASVARSILDTLGYTTICVSSGNEAMRVLENNSAIDLVFSDIVMPGGMSGLDLADAMAMQYPAVKILLTSGFTADAKHSDRAEYLIQNMVAKPYRNKVLARRVRETLDKVT